MTLFTLLQAGWVAIGLEILLLLFGILMEMNNSGSDPAGRGMAQGFMVVFIIYIGVHILLLLSGNHYCTMAVIGMAALPFLVLVFGVTKYLFSKSKDY